MPTSISVMKLGVDTNSEMEMMSMLQLLMSQMGILVDAKFIVKNMLKTIIPSIKQKSYHLARAVEIVTL